jgi:hypothetical protein
MTDKEHVIREKQVHLAAIILDINSLANDLDEYAPGFTTRKEIKDIFTQLKEDCDKAFSLLLKMPEDDWPKENDATFVYGEEDD